MSELTNHDINLAVAETEQFLTENKVDSKKIIQVRLMLEDALLNNQSHFGEHHPFTLRKKKLLGDIRILVSVAGESFDPFAIPEDEEFELLRKVQMEAENSWSYRSSVNCISFHLKRQRTLSSTQKTVIGLILGVVLGIASYALPDSARVSLLENYAQPTLDTILGIFSAVAGPMVFFSLAWGVCTIGDVETLSRIGKRMIGRFMLAQLLLAAAAVAVCLPFFHSSSAGGSSFQPAEIYELLLEIIPDNLITPFTTGNTEQIITLAVVAGIVLLLLGERGNPLTAFVEKMNAALYYLMSGVSTLIPFMVFFGMFKIAASGQFAAVLKSWKIPAMILALSILPMLLYTVIVAIRKRVSVLKLVRSASSVFLIGIMTASSSAALTENLERCEHSYGIDKKIVRFGVPLGQTIFMPGVVMFFISISFGLGENFNIAFTPNWLVLVALTSVLLAVALPPIPGGMTMVFTILFAQLSIPSEGIGIALALNIIFEYVLTSVNLVCLQLELTELAGSLDMLNLETLRNGHEFSKSK